MQDHVPVESSCNVLPLVEPHAKKKYLLLSCGMVWLRAAVLGRLDHSPNQERVLYPAHRPLLRGGEKEGAAPPFRAGE
jgi:hypothetical protein